MDTKGVYVGRFSPMHIGHESVIHTMIETHGRKNCVVVVGSCNAQISHYNPFSYQERRDFIKTVFPDINVVPLADFPRDDKIWRQALDDILVFAGWNPINCIYYDGSVLDSQHGVFYGSGRTCKTIDRTLVPHITGTRVREFLEMGEYGAATALLDPRIHADVIRSYECMKQTLETGFRF